MIMILERQIGTRNSNAVSAANLKPKRVAVKDPRSKFCELLLYTSMVYVKANKSTNLQLF